MARKGRRPTNEPATAYDYRRAIVLVQVLALADYQSLPALENLALAWTDLSPKEIRECDKLELVRTLALHALEKAGEGE